MAEMFARDGDYLVVNRPGQPERRYLIVERTRRWYTTSNNEFDQEFGFCWPFDVLGQPSQYSGPGGRRD